MKVKIITKSPVHIGSGESYSASEFIQSKAKSQGKVIETIKRIDISEYFMSLDKKEQENFLKKLSSKRFKLSSIKDNLKDYGLYTSRNKCQEFNPDKDIVEMIKTLNQIYIPGSSIKGAIKTALLYNSLNDEDISMLKHPRNINKIVKHKFSSSYVSNSPQGDIMRFLQVSDSSTRKFPSIYEVYPIMASSKNGKTFYQERLNKTNYIETIELDEKLSFELNNNFSNDVHRELRFKENQIKLIDVNYIKESVFAFSKALINHELDFSIDYGIDSLIDYYTDLEKINSPEKPLLKIGSGSGFLATTVALKVKNKKFYENIRKSLRTKTYNYEFPKSRKITRIEGMPLGWVQLAFGE